jgi:DNA mismatch repair protein MutS2
MLAAMDTYAPGDRVHVAALGTGVVREVRNGGRYLIELKGRSVLVAGEQLERVPDRKVGTRRPQPVTGESTDRAVDSTLSLDLHGRTAAEAVEILDGFLNDALLAGASGLRIIHGRSGGAVKAAVHARLRQLPSLRGFRLDPRNPGVTLVQL